MGTRHERVIVDLDDRFSRPAAGMAASVSLFRRNVEDSDRSLLKFDKTTSDVGRNIDKLSGRLGLFIDLAATLGPSVIPAASALVPLMAGLSNQLGFAAIAGGATILAFQGVGDALKAVNEQAINPSAANLEKMNEAMAKLGPAGRDFVLELQSIRPEMQKLQDAAQAGLFPGMTEGIESLMTRMPQAERIIGDISDTLGGLLADAGDSLAGPEWDEFFNTLETEGRPTLQALGESIGQVTKGLADMWIAFAPLNRDFSEGMLEASKSFADWADGLSATTGFQEFMDYLHETGPQVADTLGSIGNMLLQVLEAASPLGGPALAAIRAFSDAIAAIANSDIGTPLLAGVAAMRTFSLASGVASRATSTAWGAKAQAQAKSYSGSLLSVVSAQERANTAAGKMAQTTAMQRTALLRGAAGAAALTVATTGMADSIGLSKTAMFGLTGFMLGGGIGAAFGATAGAAIDLTHANDGLNDSLEKLSAMAGKVDLSTFNRQLAETKKQMDDTFKSSSLGDALSDTGKIFGGALKGEGGFLEQRGKARNEIADAQRIQQRADFYKDLGTQITASATAMQLANQGFTQTAAGAREAAMGVDQFTASMQGASEALDRMSNWDSFRTAVLDAKDAVADAGKTLQKNGDIIRGQGRDMQRAGLQSRGLLRNIAAQAIQTSEGMKDIGRRSKFLDDARKSFIDVAQSMGLSRRAAVLLANQLNLVDRIKAKPKVEEQGSAASKKRISSMRAEIDRLKNKMVKMDEKGAAAARARIAALRDAIASLRDKTVTINYHGVRTGAAVGGKIAEARGGFVHAFASGGLDVANRHMPELAGPGMTRVWREPETMGEAYIPLANDDRRPRARAIAAETVSLLGGTAYFADGGLSFARGGVNDGSSDVARAHRAHADAVRSNTKAINREKAAREQMIGKRDELSGTVRDTFLTDPFAGGNVWGKGGGDPRAILRADITRANAFKRQLARLKSQGLDGSALAAIAATGDVGKAASLAAMGKAGVNQYESLYKQRAVAAAAVGKYAGQAAYGPAIAAIDKKLSQLVHATHHGNKQRDEAPHKHGRAVGDAINRTAASARRRNR